MLTFQKLDVYQVAIQFLALTAEMSVQASKTTTILLDQLFRAATSVSLNIAEGSGRTSQADKARHYAIARGSAMECAAALDALFAMKAVGGVAHSTGNELLAR